MLVFKPDESVNVIMSGKVRGLGLLYNKKRKIIGIVFFDGKNNFTKIFNKDLVIHSKYNISTKTRIKGIKITNNTLEE